MSIIKERLATAKQLIPYVMAGFKDLAASKSIIEALVDSGCGIIEIGIPYSDPLADGPTIQRASEVALSENIDTDDVFRLIREVKAERDFSPILMVYYNLVYRYGLERFADEAAKAGVEGLIIPDLSVEESSPWTAVAGRYKLDTIFLAAPTSSDERISKITAAASGFVYCVSLTGVTGARAALPTDITDFLSRVREKTILPLAVGFGISSAEQARKISEVAEGIIIGSAFVNMIEKAKSLDEAVSAVSRFSREIVVSLSSDEIK